MCEHKKTVKCQGSVGLQSNGFTTKLEFQNILKELKLILLVLFKRFLNQVLSFSFFNLSFNIVIRCDKVKWIQETFLQQSQNDKGPTTRLGLKRTG